MKALKINPYKTLSLLIILTLCSCTVKKRAYRSGYYVEWNKHTSHPLASTQIKPKKEIVRNADVEILNPVQESQTEEVVSSEKIISLPKKSKATIFNKDECNDLITMRNGDEVKGKVIEVSEKQIKYKRCDNLDGPLIVLNKSEVFMIKYANGAKDIFKEEKPVTQKPNNNSNSNPSSFPQQQRVHPLAIGSILCSTIGILIGAGPLVGLILGINALREINADPLRWTGKGFAIAGIVIGGLVILLILLILIFAISGI